MDRRHKGNNKITEHRGKTHKATNRKNHLTIGKLGKTAMALTWYRLFQRNGGLNQILQTTYDTHFEGWAITIGL